MPLDPQAQAIIDQFNAAGTPPLETLPVKEARELLQAMAAMQGDPPAIARIDNRTVPGAAGEIPVRIYTPRLRSSPLPALVYFHGGGWVLGNLESHEGVCRTLANSADCIVISVDLLPKTSFRLPPRMPSLPQNGLRRTRGRSVPTVCAWPSAGTVPAAT
jgi:acetyl esterase